MSKELSPTSSTGSLDSDSTTERNGATSGNLGQMTDRVRAELVGLDSPENLRKYLLLNRESLDKVPVALLNSWIPGVPSLRFYKNHGFLNLRKTETKKEGTEALEKRLAELTKRFNDLCSIINAHSQSIQQLQEFLSQNGTIDQAGGKRTYA
jgi:hypothetical protein